MTTIFRKTLPCLLITLAALTTAKGMQAQFEGPAVGSALSRPASDLSATGTRPEIDVLHSDDIVSIQVLGLPEFSSSSTSFARPLDPNASMQSGASSAQLVGLRIAQKGTIQLPFLGPFMAAGKDSDTLAAEIADQLKSRGILTDPQVFVTLLDSPSRSVSIVGEVARPVRVPVLASASLADIFAAAGGLTPMASHSITIHRVGLVDPIHIDLGLNAASPLVSAFRLLPGDTVIVPKVGTGYVLGMVKTPMAIPLGGNGPVTVMRAIALAGGVPFGAAMSKVRLIHNDPVQGRTETRIDLAKLMKGNQIDPVFEANDILWVPRNPVKATITGGGAAVFSNMLYGLTYMANTVR